MKRKTKVIICSLPKKYLRYIGNDEYDGLPDLENLTLRRIMKQTEIEILMPVEFHTAFTAKTYHPGIHSIDADLAKLLVRSGSARNLLPKKAVPSAKESKY